MGLLHCLEHQEFPYGQHFNKDDLIHGLWCVSPCRHDGRAATRESSFVDAVTAAGVAFAITRSCSQGLLEGCSCSEGGSRADHDWKWRGCSDDVDFGSRAAEHFLGTLEDAQDAPALVSRHNNYAGRMVRHNTYATFYVFSYCCLIYFVTYFSRSNTECNVLLIKEYVEINNLSHRSTRWWNSPRDGCVNATECRVPAPPRPAGCSFSPSLP